MRAFASGDSALRVLSEDLALLSWASCHSSALPRRSPYHRSRFYLTSVPLRSASIAISRMCPGCQHVFRPREKYGLIRTSPCHCQPYTRFGRADPQTPAPYNHTKGSVKHKHTTKIKHDTPNHTNVQKKCLSWRWVFVQTFSTALAITSLALSLFRWSICKSMAETKTAATRCGVTFFCPLLVIDIYVGCHQDSVATLLTPPYPTHPRLTCRLEVV